MENQGNVNLQALIWKDTSWVNLCLQNMNSSGSTFHNPALPLNIINDSHFARVKDSDIAEWRSFILHAGVIGGHEGKGLVPA